MLDRRYPSRPFCGVGVVVLKDDAVLLVRRGREPRKGDWSIPGGLQHVGETVAEAAAREVKEETGVDVRLFAQLGVVDSVRHDRDGRIEYHYTLIEFGAEWVAGEAIPADDVDRAVWVPLSEIGQYNLWSETARYIALAAERRKAS